MLIQFSSMYKNMYNPKSKTKLLLLSFVATMLTRIQSNFERKKNEIKRRLVRPNKRSELILFEICIFVPTLKKSPTLSMLISLGPHSVYT